ncbi:phosphatidylinositol 3-kinase [Tieghemostelium lacteum]|uniref:Phosphatidylinositol 3-kinase n=1 Tax=Tieghemostelium lacteum TaxID=361077 RepID=A0A151Z697_TIELA|nr:phosphatidylinositol 3-kinase [Tieghemostelium lacteum]|eukprot:KYQ89458.1 phosphatidylinositol 3-kinase [Tieghemostelium lacteum]
MDQNRYSKSFIEDGFNINVNIGNLNHQISFSSSVTVDHVKLEIVRQFLPNHKSNDYFLSLAKNEILQIEFVRFIFAHEDIQKSLLTKNSVDVFLVPKSKEIIKRKSEADRIKRQLGTYNKNRYSKKYNLGNGFLTEQAKSGLRKLNTGGSGASGAGSGKTSPVQSRKSSNIDIRKTPPLLSLGSAGNLRDSSQQHMSLPVNSSLTIDSGSLSTGTAVNSNSNTSAGTVGNNGNNNNNSLGSGEQKSPSQSPSSPNQITQLGNSIDLEMMEDETTEMIKLQLQQQLVLLEDEELKYQTNLLVTDTSGSEFENDDLLETDGDDELDEEDEDEEEEEEEEKVSDAISNNATVASLVVDDKEKPRSPSKSPKSSTLLVPGSQNVNRKSRDLLNGGHQNKFLISRITRQQQQQMQSVPNQQQQQNVNQPIRDPNVINTWTDYLTMKPITANNDIGYLPVRLQVNKDLDIVMKCSTNYTSNEFKSSILNQLEKIMQAVKVGTFATEVESQFSTISSNTVINDLFNTSIGGDLQPLPTLIVLKPGLQELYKNTSDVGSPKVNLQSSLNLNKMANLSLDSPVTQQAQQPQLQLVQQQQGQHQINGSPVAVNPLLSQAISNSGGLNSSTGAGGGSRFMRNVTISLGEQRDHNVKALQQKKKLAQIQISSLLGKPLYTTNTENEIKYFRNLAEQIFDFNHLDSRDRCKVTVASMTSASADPLLPSMFRIRFYLPPDNHSTMINVNGQDTIGEIIERVITKHNNSTRLLSSDHKASDYVIRITGTSDHCLDDNVPIVNLTFVRYRLQRKKDINLSLVLKSSLPSIYIDGFSEPMVTHRQVSLALTYQQSQQQSATNQQPQNVGVGNPLSPRLLNSNNAANGASNTGSSPGRSILLYEINRPFELRIICLENLNNQIFTHFLPETPLNDIKLSISVSLCHGEELLTDTMDASLKASSNPLWCEWMRSALLMSDIPRATKLSFTVYAQTDQKNRVSIGWVDLQLIDYRGQLLSGVISLNLWPGSRTSTPDFSVQTPSLVIEFVQFPFPVQFPKPEMMQKTEIRDYVDARKEDSQRLDEIIAKDPLYQLTESDKKFIWTYRMHLRHSPHSLPKVLQSLHWNNPQEVKEAHRLLSIWSPLSPTEALELLDVKFADELVREYAVNCIRDLNDSQLNLYLLQLVQSIKHEPYHDSALSRFLIQRALNNRAVIGHPLFWHLEAEIHNPKISERYSLVLETFLKGCGDQRHEFVKEMEVVTKLTYIAKLIKDTNPNKRKALLHEELNKVSWPNTFHLPISPSMESCGIVVSECRWLDSFTVPLYLVFQNVDPVGEPIIVIFKTGDDLRQDILTLQMITLMDSFWKENGLDLHLSIYNVTAINEDTGFIEVVTDSDTVANIQKAAGGVTAAFTKTPLANWLHDRNTTDQEYEFAVQNFIHSLAGYCVATYVLGISDRHNDNIMVSNSGHLFHIDFAHFLGNIMKFHGYKREKAPFVLTPEFAHVMGGEKSQNFKWFSDLCCLSYKFIRKHRNLFIILFSLMISTGIPELTTKEDIDYLREAFLMDLNDEEAAASFADLIQKSLKTKTTQILFALHILSHMKSDKPDQQEK